MAEKAWADAAYMAMWSVLWVKLKRANALRVRSAEWRYWSASLA